MPSLCLATPAGEGTSETIIQTIGTHRLFTVGDFFILHKIQYLFRDIPIRYRSDRSRFVDNNQKI